MGDQRQKKKSMASAGVTEKAKRTLTAEDAAVRLMFDQQLSARREEQIDAAFEQAEKTTHEKLERRKAELDAAVDEVTNRLNESQAAEAKKRVDSLVAEKEKEKS